MNEKTFYTYLHRTELITKLGNMDIEKVCTSTEMLGATSIESFRALTHGDDKLHSNPVYCYARW